MSKDTKKSIDKPWRNWCFTLFHYTQDQIKNLQKIDENICKYIIYGHEICKDGKPHLQGYIELKKVQRLTGVKKILDPINGKRSPIHLSPANKDRKYQTIYCSKGLQSKEEYEKLGQDGPNYGIKAKIYEQIFQEYRGGQGKRNDWVELYNKITEDPKFSTILQEYPEYAIKYPNGIQKAIDTIISEINECNLLEEMNNLKLYIWESNLLKELDSKPDSRKIIWYVDTIGGCGKSTFAKYLLSKGDCAYFTNARSADIAYAYKGERTVIFDFTRSIEGHVNYSIIESIKNGIVFCSKYNSNTKINCVPHIICFSNFDPELSKLSEDRWDIRQLNKDLCIIEPKSAENCENNIECAITHQTIETEDRSSATMAEVTLNTTCQASAIDSIETDEETNEETSHPSDGGRSLEGVSPSDVLQGVESDGLTPSSDLPPSSVGMGVEKSGYTCYTDPNIKLSSDYFQKYKEEQYIIWWHKKKLGPLFYISNTSWAWKQFSKIYDEDD